MGRRRHAHGLLFTLEPDPAILTSRSNTAFSRGDDFRPRARMTPHNNGPPRAVLRQEEGRLAFARSKRAGDTTPPPRGAESARRPETLYEYGREVFARAGIPKRHTQSEEFWHASPDHKARRRPGAACPPLPHHGVRLRPAFNLISEHNAVHYANELQNRTDQDRPDHNACRRCSRHLVEVRPPDCVRGTTGPPRRGR